MKRVLLLTLLIVSLGSISLAQTGTLPSDTTNKPFVFKKRGPYVMMEMGMLVLLKSLGYRYSDGLHLMGHVGWQINRFVTVGAGGGTMRIFASNKEYGLNLFPVYGHMEVNLTKWRFTPVFSFKSGYSFGKSVNINASGDGYSVNSDFSGNYFVNPSIGVRMNLFRLFSWHINAGWFFQKLSVENRVTGVVPATAENVYYRNGIHMLTVRTGFMF